MFEKPPGPRAEPTAQGAAPVPARRFTDEAAAGTVIGAGTRIKGEIKGGDALDLAGRLEGVAEVAGLCRVRPGAEVVGGRVKADRLLIEGDVSVREVVADKVEIGAAARVRGELRARLIAVAEGAYFDGPVHMDGREGPAGPSSFKEKRRPR
jgi:cytoskeletal protein CcmA (bactofilin family)